MMEMIIVTVIYLLLLGNNVLLMLDTKQHDNIQMELADIVQYIC